MTIQSSNLQTLSFQGSNPQTVTLKSTSLRDAFSIVFRRKTVVLACILATVLIAVFAALFLPRYHGEAKILVDRERVDPVMSPTPEMSSFALAAQPIVTDEDLRSEVEMMESTEVLTAVAKQAGLADSPSTTWWGKLVHSVLPVPTYDERLAAKTSQLAHDLVIEPAKGSDIIDITYKSKNRELAKRVMDTLVQVYMAKHTAVHHPAGQYLFFAQQAASYRKKMEAAEAQLARFPETGGSVAPALDRELTMQKLADFRFSLEETRAAAAATEQQIRLLRKQEHAIPARITTQVRKSDNPQLLEQLKSSLLTLELRRSDLLTKYQPDYRPVQDLDAQIAEAKAAIQTELSSPLGDVTTDVDPTHQIVRSDLAKAETDLAGYKARETATQAIIHNYSARARELDASSIKEASLERNFRAEEENYLLYRKKSEEARISDALDAHRMVNVTVAEAPLVPALPSHSPLFFGALALVALSSASLGLIGLLEHMDRTFHAPHELEACLGIPVLVAIPRQFGAATQWRQPLLSGKAPTTLWSQGTPSASHSMNGNSGTQEGAL
jgi:uncharacterized protein involved in exopolysaccharide biosynthesis